MAAKPSALLLLLVNLLPIAGVLWLDWSVLDILLLYWTESVVVGIINVLRMATCGVRNPLRGLAGADARPELAAATELVGTALRSTKLKFFLIPFFILHFGAFCYAHLSAIVLIFARDGRDSGLFSTLPSLSEMLFWVMAGAIFLSHLFSFFANYLGSGEYQRTGLAELMRQPYARIVVMHVTVILGAGLTEWADNPLPMLLVLVAVKTVIDLRLHARERRKLSAAHARPDVIHTVGRSPS